MIKVKMIKVMKVKVMKVKVMKIKVMRNISHLQKKRRLRPGSAAPFRGT